MLNPTQKLNPNATVSMNKKLFFIALAILILFAFLKYEVEIGVLPFQIPLPAPDTCPPILDKCIPQSTNDYFLPKVNVVLFILALLTWAYAIVYELRKDQESTKTIAWRTIILVFIWLVGMSFALYQSSFSFI